MITPSTVAPADSPAKKLNRIMIVIRDFGYSDACWEQETTQDNRVLVMCTEPSSWEAQLDFGCMAGKILKMSHTDGFTLHGISFNRIDPDLPERRAIFHISFDA